MNYGRIVIAIPDTPPSLNMFTKLHWAAQAREKDQWQTRIRLECLKWKLPKDVGVVHATAIFRFPSKRRRDIGNFQSTLEKFTGDALQPDWLADDTHDRFTFSARISEEVGPKLTTIAFDFWHEQMPHPRLAA